MKTTEHRVWNVPTLVVSRRVYTSRAQAGQEFARPEMRYLSPTTRVSWNPGADFPLTSLSDVDLDLPSRYFALRIAVDGDAQPAEFLGQAKDFRTVEVGPGGVPTSCCSTPTRWPTSAGCAALPASCSHAAGGPHLAACGAAKITPAIAFHEMLG